MDYYAIARQPRFSKRRRVGYGLFFLFSLIFLVAGSLPALFNLPGLQARFTGLTTTALVTLAGSCGSDSEDGESFYYMFTFTDNHGKEYQVTNTSVCSSGIVSDGERVTIWYQPADPTKFITKNDLTFDAIFFAGFSIPMLLWIIFFPAVLVRLLLGSRRRYESIRF